MLSKEALSQLIARAITVSFSRSQGPGGQNVNKVNTKVTAALNLDELTFFSEEEYECLSVKLKNRITKDGFLVIQVQDKRTQNRNLALAVERLTTLILDALRPPKKRKKTRVPPSARVKRREEKTRRTETKQLRRTPRHDE